MSRETLCVVKELVKLYYGNEDWFYINLALNEIARGFTIADVQEMMEQAEL